MFGVFYQLSWSNASFVHAFSNFSLLYTSHFIVHAHKISKVNRELWLIFAYLLQLTMEKYELCHANWKNLWLFDKKTWVTPF